MKKLRCILCFAILIVAFSCEDDEGAEQDMIIALWSLEATEEQGVNTPASGCELSHTLLFSEDFTGNNYFPENDVNSPCDFETITFMWSRNSDQLVLDSVAEGNFIIEILLLTDTQLQISVLENDNIPIPESQRRILKYKK